MPAKKPLRTGLSKRSREMPVPTGTLHRCGRPRTTHNAISSLVLASGNWLFDFVAAVLAFKGRPVAPNTNLAKRMPQPVGSLKWAPKAKFAGKKMNPGDAFTEGDVVVLESGEANVSMASGAEFVLKARPLRFWGEAG